MRDGRVNYLRLTAIYGYIALNPGSRQAQIARAFGLQHANTTRHLQVMEGLGFLLWEDDRGRIYTYRILGARNATGIQEAR